MTSSTLNLAGLWHLTLDPTDTGHSLGYATADLPPLAHPIHLPASLEERGYGDLPSETSPFTPQLVENFPVWKSLHPTIPLTTAEGRFRMPYALTPSRFYVGPAWFSRSITIPPEWANHRITLHLERPHWTTTVYLNGKRLGSCNALGTPHEYHLPIGSGEHHLSIRTDNRTLDLNPGQNSHSISDHTQGNWNGLTGTLELRATPLISIKNIQLHPHFSRTTSIEAHLTLQNDTATPIPATLGAAQAAPTQLTLPPGTSVHTLSIPLPENLPLWDEFSPNLHTLTFTLTTASTSHEVTETFGLRDLSVKGTQLSLNGHPISLRGTLECCIFPKTGYPPTDIDSWKRIITICKAHGLNHIRFHSWCPPKAAFIAADQLGFYYQVECSSWANQGATVGDGAPLDQWLYEEADRMIAHYGNHPSFTLMCYGNEPAGDKHTEYLSKFVSHYKAKDPRRLYTSAAGWTVIPEADYDSVHAPRLHQWLDHLKSRLNAQPPDTLLDFSDHVAKHTKPIISHEIGQWCVFPNLNEVPKYSGNLQPRNFELFAELLASRNLLTQASDFLHASGKLQALCYKEEIEAALRTPGFGGIQLLDLHDFPGQGTALVGLLDPFWDEKGYITAAEFSRFCNATIPLAKLPARVFSSGDTLTADLLLYHFSPEPLPSRLNWSLTSQGKTLAAGNLPLSADLYTLTPVGKLSIPLAVQAPEKLTLEVTCGSRSNSWDLWVFPRVATVNGPTARFVSSLQEALPLLAKGETVLLNPAPAAFKDTTPPTVAGFTPIFWNTAWTQRQAPTTLGLLMNPAHPLFQYFPTDGHTDWHFWHLLKDTRPMVLNHLPKVTPTIQMIDDWFTSNRLGYLLEARVGQGKLLLCAFNLSSDSPSTQAFKHALQTYAASASFAPVVELTEDDLSKLFG